MFQRTQPLVLVLKPRRVCQDVDTIERPTIIEPLVSYTPRDERDARSTELLAGFQNKTAPWNFQNNTARETGET